jgi:ABC-type glycerol-3-phosphate transport system permease component
MEVMRLGWAQRTARWVILGIGLVYTVLPILWILSIAVREVGAVVFPVPLLPTSVTLDNFFTVLFGSGVGYNSGMGIGPFLNAGIYGLTSALMTALISLLGGYALARYDVPAGRVLLLVFLGLSFLPSASRLVPLFLIFTRTGLYDTRLGIILAYASGSVPLGIWLMAASIRQIPVRLEQAARVDGAGPWTVARRIVLPLALPGLLVVATLAFVDGWNSFALPLILLKQPDAQPFTIVMQKYATGDFGVNWTGLAAASVLGALPVLITFAIMHRRLIPSGGFTGAIQG